MNRLNRIGLVSVVAAALMSGWVNDRLMADDGPDPTALHLRTGTVTLDKSASLHKTAIGEQPLSAADHFIIQLDGPLSRERTASLRAAGINLGQYVPMHAYLVNLPKGFRVSTALSRLPFVRYIGPYDHTWKLDPQIGQATFKTQNRLDLASAGKVKLTIKLFEGEDLFTTANQIMNMGGVEFSDIQQRDNGGLLEVIIPRAKYAQLAGIPAVQFVEEAGEITPRGNDTNQWIIQSNVNALKPIWDHGITGVGQVGGHIDDTLNPSHCVFRDPNGNPIGPTHRKILAYYGTQGYSTHGTITGGIFIGDPFPISGDPTYRGLAYGAKVVCARLADVTSTNFLSKLNQDHASVSGIAGARVHTNSWGTDGTVAYNQQCVDIDTFSYQNEDDLVLFAVTDQSTVIQTPENAKDCIGVSGSGDTPSQDSWCVGGWAPTADGRRKPEMLTPGCGDFSSVGSGNSCSYGSFSVGTSYACPSAAGAAILVRQYYTDGFYPSGAANSPDGFTPSGALIKSTLINACVNMNGSQVTGFPNVREGYGRVQLNTALVFTGDTRKLIVKDVRNASGMTTGQSTSYLIDVHSNSVPLKVVLVWTEQAAALGANPAYINNLDLTVTDPSNNIYKGNVFDSASGQSITGGSADTKNNSEAVILNSPISGTYTVTVAATAVNTPAPQGFALSMTGDASVHTNGPIPLSIVPNSANSGGAVAITALNGSNFQTVGATTVKLRQTGYPDILATSVVVSSSNLITCNFDLTAAEPGAWDVVVTNPDSQTGVLRGGFTVNLVCTPGDINRDGVVDGLDIARFISIYLTGDGIPVEICSGDLDPSHDGAINDDDITPFVNCVLNGGC